MAIKRSSQGGTPFGTTANRPASPAVGQTYYNGTLGYLEIYTASGWTAAAKAIPFGNTAARPANPVIGEPYFNGQEARLELYTSNGWQNIVQETPAVVSIVGQLNETTTSTLTINGTNFAQGAIAYVVGTNGVETVANTTTLVSVVEITAVFPALSPSLAPYDVKVVNTSNLYGVLYETLGVNDSPVWSTSAGSLGTFTELDVISITVAATDTVDSTNSPLQYTVVSGALPAGLSLNASTGVISGTASNVIPDTTYSFTLGASDSRNAIQTRAFSITINDRFPTWTTSSVLPIFTRNAAYSTSVSATDDDSGAITYSLISGSLPTGLSLSSAGVISGTPTSSINAAFTIRATVTASGRTADRAFTMANLASVWSTSAGVLTAATKDSSYSYQLAVSDDDTITYSLLSGSLPTGITLSSSGLLSGTPTVGSAGTASSFTIRATDTNSVSIDRAFSIYVLSSITTAFTSSGTWTNTSGLTLSSVNVVLVAGGASGAMYGTNVGCGGGGAGGVVTATLSNVAPNASYVYTIGGGGAAKSGNQDFGQNGNNGTGSTFTGLTTADGGGYGGTNMQSGGSGGSGGGGSRGSNSSATSGQGNGGSGGDGGQYGGGGGGGKGSSGSSSGAGGSGASYYGYTVAGGGGGGRSGGSPTSGGSGIGGGGGGNGQNGSNAQVNTGSGGGGSAALVSGSGSSGILILNYVG
jgi:hypothetical protein